MIGLIGFDKLDVNCVIGCLEEERIKSQLIHIYLKIQTNVGKAVASDNVEDTISYIDLTEICTEIAKKGKYHLLEKLAYEIVKVLFKQFEDIRWIWVKIEKPHVLPHVGNTHVEYEEFREIG